MSSLCGVEPISEAIFRFPACFFAGAIFPLSGGLDAAGGAFPERSRDLMALATWEISDLPPFFGGGFFVMGFLTAVAGASMPFPSTAGGRPKPRFVLVTAVFFREAI